MFHFRSRRYYYLFLLSAAVILIMLDQHTPAKPHRRSVPAAKLNDYPIPRARPVRRKHVEGQQKETPTPAFPSAIENAETVDLNSDMIAVSLWDDKSIIRDCISHAVIGRVPVDIQTMKYKYYLTMAGGIQENWIERRHSFIDIFKNNIWTYSLEGETEDIDVSGPRSTMIWTEKAIAGLHSIINKIKEKFQLTRVKFLDIGCGDMNWMSHFLTTRDDIDYTGVDIVQEIIEHNRETYATTNPQWEFRELDLVEAESLEAYDLVLCRLVLQHLHTGDAGKVLQKISDSGSRYFLATTFSAEDSNPELVLLETQPERFREINLEVPPFSLEPPICLQSDGPAQDWPQYLGLWRLPLRQVTSCEQVKSFTLKNTEQMIHSCVAWKSVIETNDLT